MIPLISTFAVMECSLKAIPTKSFTGLFLCILWSNTHTTAPL